MSSAAQVTTGNRLHFGPLAAGGEPGRAFGGIGLMVTDPGCEVVIRPASTDQYAGPVEFADRVRTVLDRLRAAHGDLVPPAVNVELRSAVPLHSGFGGGTQLALAVARGATWDRELAVPGLARTIWRGAGTGIGGGGF